MVVSEKRKNQKGMAMIETIPILVIFLVLLGYGLGYFGVVHTGILHSIAARNYAFETFRNRTNLSYFRDRQGTDPNAKVLYSNIGNRVHGINSEEATEPDVVVATSRRLDFSKARTPSNVSEAQHNNEVFTITGRNRKGQLETSPVWIMISYGICLDALCGGE